MGEVEMASVQQAVDDDDDELDEMDWSARKDA